MGSLPNLNREVPSPAIWCDQQIRMPILAPLLGTTIKDNKGPSGRNFSGELGCLGRSAYQRLVEDLLRDSKRNCPYGGLDSLPIACRKKYKVPMELSANVVPSSVLSNVVGVASFMFPITSVLEQFRFSDNHIR